MEHEEKGASMLMEVYTNDAVTLTAEKPEHCIACCRLIRPSEPYHQTAENSVFCQECADRPSDSEILDTIQATDDLAVDTHTCVKTYLPVF